MRKVSRVINVFISALLLLIVINACSIPEIVQQGTSATQPSTQQDITVTSEKKTEDKIVFPLKEQIELTYYGLISSSTGLPYSSWAEMELYKILQEKTNIKLTFIHPPAGDNGTTLSLMIAARDVPDIIESYKVSADGSKIDLQKARDEGLIIPLNGYLEEYAPDYYKILKDDPEIDKLVQFRDSEYLNFQYMLIWDTATSMRGLAARGDWLDELGLNPTVTIEEFEAMLKAFQEQKGVQHPLGLKLELATNAMMNIGGAYNINVRGFYPDNGKIKYGPYDPAYREFLALLKRWYDAEFLAKDSPMLGTKQNEGNFASGNCGVFEISDGGINRITQQGLESDPNFFIRPLDFPVLNAGDTNRFVWATDKVSITANACISSTNPYPAESVMFLNYGYTEEGSTLFSFGVEGITYNVDENGKLVLTDSVKENPAASTYGRGAAGGPYLLHKDYMEAQAVIPQQIEASKVWGKSLPAYRQNCPSISYSADRTQSEQEERTQKMAPITTYVNEMFLKFVTGVEPLENFDKYIQQLKSMGIEDLIKIEQNAYDRFYK